MDGKKYPLVSVIINCFNGSEFLREAMESVFEQTYKNWEIIFWDNASTDDSASIAKSFGERVQYFNNSVTVPLGKARKQAIEKASGEFIALLDCDDIWLPNRLEKQMNKMRDGQYALCYSGVTDIDCKGNKIRSIIPRYRSGYMFSEQLRQFDVNVPSILINAKYLQKLELTFDEKVFASEEYCLFMQLAAVFPICTIREPLVKYRVNPKSLTEKSINRWAIERRYVINILKNKYPELAIKFSREFSEALARSDYYETRYLLSLGKKKEARKKIRKVALIGSEYLVFYMLLFLPISIWNIFHSERVKRFLTSKVFSYSESWD